jgi:hypothetical protein
MKDIHVKITFIEEVLGTSPSDPQIFEQYVASNAPDAPKLKEEVAAIGASGVTERSMTIFPKEGGRLFLWDYQVKGFFKDACSMLSRVKTTNESSKLRAYKKVIDGLIFVSPRKILLEFEGEVGTCQRPLRASTPQGERIALASSETVPAGTSAVFTIKLLSDEHEEAVIEWLDYGELRGLSQWRNSGKGRFTYEIVEEPDRL